MLVAQTAFAQYPPPQTNLVCAVSQVDLNVSSNVLFAATLHDASGAAITGQAVEFSVVSGDAKLSSSSARPTPMEPPSSTLSAQTLVTSYSAQQRLRRVPRPAQVNSIRPPATGDAGLAATNHRGNTPAL